MPQIHGGVWPALLTPFDDNQMPNLEMLARLIETLMEQGLDGLYLLGTTGQGLALTEDERIAVTDHALAVVGGRVPVIVHVGAVTTAASVRLATHAAGAGADGISCVPPAIFPATAAGVYRHYELVGAATNLPFFPYHHAMFGDSLLQADNFGDRLLGIPNIAGMKITIRDLFVFGSIHQQTRGSLVLFSGADELLCHAVVAGAVGAIGTFYNLWGTTCQAVRADFASGNVGRGVEFMADFQAVLEQILSSNSVYAFLRSAMRIKFGIEIGPSRIPGHAVEAAWNDDDVSQIVARIDRW